MPNPIGLILIAIYLWLIVGKREQTINRMRKSNKFTFGMTALYFASIAAVLCL